MTGRLAMRTASRTMVGGFAAAAALLAAACGQGPGDGGSGDVQCSAYSAECMGETPSDWGTVDLEDTVYRGALTVLQDDEDGSPELCGAVAESYPPQCGGLPVDGWDWDAVAHDEASGVRWGTYLVTGVFDGSALALIAVPQPTSEIDMADYPELEYTEPEFGEPAEDLSAAELQAIADELAEAFPALVFAGYADEGHGVAIVDALLVTPEMRAYAEEHFPEDTVVFTTMMKPVE